MEVCLAPVHEVQEYLEVVGAGAVEDDEELVVERRRDGRVVEDGGEVGAACCQHETVRFEGLTCKNKYNGNLCSSDPSDSNQEANLLLMSQ